MEVELSQQSKINNEKCYLFPIYIKTKKMKEI
jgi:hypothetical protein